MFCIRGANDSPDYTCLPVAEEFGSCKDPPYSSSTEVPVGSKHACHPAGTVGGAVRQRTGQNAYSGSRLFGATGRGEETCEQV